MKKRTLKDLAQLFAMTYEMQLDLITEVVKVVNEPELHAYLIERLTEYRNTMLDTFSEIPTEPVPFTGSENERLFNRESHQWVDSDGEIRCFRCDAKTWHAAADYPCEEKVPRRVMR